MAKRKAVTKRPPPRYGHRSQKRIMQETSVYLMLNFPFFFLNKFGISDSTTARVKNVSETTPGSVSAIVDFKLAFGYEVEQFVHRLYRIQNIHFWTGSGRTEWFLVFSPIVGTVVLYFDFRFNLGLSAKHLALVYFTPFVWLDGLLWLLFFRVLKLIALAALFFLFVYILAHHGK